MHRISTVGIDPYPGVSGIMPNSLNAAGDLDEILPSEFSKDLHRKARRALYLQRTECPLFISDCRGMRGRCSSLLYDLTTLCNPPRFHLLAGPWLAQARPTDAWAVTLPPASSA